MTELDSLVERAHRLEDEVKAIGVELRASAERLEHLPPLPSLDSLVSKARKHQQNLEDLKRLLTAIKKETIPIPEHTDPKALIDCWNWVFEILEAESK